MKRIRVWLGSIAVLFNVTLHAQSLEPIERKWIEAADPVLEFAVAQGLPIDVTVLPEREPGDIPLSMGVKDGRCKLVLSLRGNPDAEDTLSALPRAQHALMIEAMAAHEIAHCWRYSQGLWLKSPAGFSEPNLGVEVSMDDTELHKKKLHLRAMRHEEAFADLVALAWMLRRHPDNYETVYQWLTRLRNDPSVAGGYHDTRAWLKLANHPQRFSANDNVFEQARPLWLDGLQREH